MRVLGQAINRPSAWDGGGTTAEMDGLSRSRRSEETEQREDCDGWTKQAHTSSTIAATDGFGPPSNRTASNFLPARPEI
jgi:hypothetical protein